MAMKAYADLGGRLFRVALSNVWICCRLPLLRPLSSAPRVWNTIATWNCGTNLDNPASSIPSSDEMQEPEGASFADWDASIRHSWLNVRDY